MRGQLWIINANKRISDCGHLYTFICLYTRMKYQPGLPDFGRLIKLGTLPMQGVSACYSISWPLKQRLLYNLIVEFDDLNMSVLAQGAECSEDHRKENAYFPLSAKVSTGKQSQCSLTLFIHLFSDSVIIRNYINLCLQAKGRVCYIYKFLTPVMLFFLNYLHRWLKKVIAYLREEY
jgi:hypothetical protein